MRMPPGMKDDGALAARQLRMRYPDLAIVLLSQHVETSSHRRVLAVLAHLTHQDRATSP
jgi:DNA-binding NarL/FixJ family response regulator